MDFFGGQRLTVLGAALIALAAVAAVRVAVTGGVAGTAARTDAPRAEAVPGAGAAPGAEAALAAARRVALARSAERRGDVAAALSHYRAAVVGDPRCVDRRSPGYLGDAFEEKLKGWIAGMNSGRIAAGPAARDDASFIFRTMYGGCG